jgi:hypothetical protein
MCKPSMFSYRAGLCKPRQLKRVENHFNGVEASSSGARESDQRNEFFALDSSASIPHSRNTSQTISVAGLAKLMFACQPCCGIAILLTLLFSTQSEPAPSV